MPRSTLVEQRAEPTAAQPQRRVPGQRGSLLACSVIAAALLTSMPAWSQSSASTSMATNDAAAMKGGSTAAKADSKFMGDIAQANLAEIATGKLALEKTQSDDVKKFARQMVDDHTKALDELTALASKKGVTLPDAPNAMQKSEAAALRVLSGKTFDNRYMAHAGVGDHERTVKLLQKVQAGAKDADLKAMVDKTLPVVQQHLVMARETKGKKM